MKCIPIWLVLLPAVCVLCAISPAVGQSFTLNGTQHLNVTSYYANGYLNDVSSASVMSGGTIGYAYTYDTSSLTLSGGTVSGILRAYESSKVDMVTGNVADFRTYNGSHADVSGGNITTALWTFADSTADVSGGNIAAISAYDNSVMRISGGVIASYLETVGSSNVDISGGVIPNLYAYSTSTITFRGYDYTVSGGNLRIVGQQVLGTGTLKGKWADGTPWSVKIVEHDSTCTIMAVPEPGSMLVLGTGLIGMAGLLVRGRKS